MHNHYLLSILSIYYLTICLSDIVIILCIYTSFLFIKLLYYNTIMHLNIKHCHRFSIYLVSFLSLLCLASVAHG